MEPEGTSATTHESKRKRRKRSAEEIVLGYQPRLSVWSAIKAVRHPG